MGFDETMCKKALKKTKNNLEQAIEALFNNDGNFSNLVQDEVLEIDDGGENVNVVMSMGFS